MPQEAIIADFSGGMNASAGMDKLAENECLLAENVRFDEQGNVIITGANTLQNTASLAGSVHSVFFDPLLGAISGAGTAVYTGKDFTSLSLSTATNQNSSKMSFGSGPNRVYMDLMGTGYFIDNSITDLMTVDWTPPQTNTSGGATVTGPKIAGTGISTGTQSATWVNPNNITSTSTTNVATIFMGAPYLLQSQYLRASTFAFAIGAAAVQGIVVNVTAKTGTALTTATVYATLLKNGVPIGDTRSGVVPNSFTTLTFGGATDLWGATWLPGDINSASFGVQIQIVLPSNEQAVTVSVYQAKITVYQSDATLGFGAGTGAAGTLTGTYTWKVAFTAANGEEGQASNASTGVALSAQQGTVTAIPTGDARTTGRNIYRKGGQLSSYYLVGSIGDNISTTYSDNMTDLAALTQGIILAGDTVGDEPNTRLGNQAVKYPTYHYDRVFWASGSTLIWSKPLNGFAYPADFSTPVGDGKDITGIFSMGGQLFILKPDSIWQFTGTDENSFQLSKTLSPVGTNWPFTAVLSGGASSGFYFTGRILFANSRGIWAFNGYTSNKITPKLDAWFRQNDHTGISVFGATGFHVPEIVSSAVTMLNCAAANPLFYYLAYAESGQMAPNAMLALDLERGAISKRSFAAQSLVADPVEGYIYGGNATGNILKLDDWGAANNGLGVAVNVDFQDHYRDLGLRGSRFSLEGLEFLLTTTGETLLATIYFDEGQANETLGAISTPTHSTAKVYRKVQSAASRFCRNFSIRLNYQGKLVNSSNIPNIQLIHIKAYFDPRGARARTGEAP